MDETATQEPETPPAESSPTESEQKSQPRDIRTVGSIVTFGQYDVSKGVKSDIEWIVLDVQDDQSLLLSKNALDCIPYNKNYGPITWADASIRRWLNGEFYSAAFSKEEQERIVRTAVDNSSKQCNENWKSAGGANTKDQVFLLSYAEANMLLSQEEMKCKPTPYAVLKGTETYEGGGKNNGNCWWWLRSPGSKGYNAAGVRYDGSIIDEHADYSAGAVRPAIWVDTTGMPVVTKAIPESETIVEDDSLYGTALSDTSVDSGQKTTKFSLESGDYHTPGSVVRFGSFEQDGNPYNGQEEIEWTVLEWTDENHLLLISSYALDCRPFNIWGDPANITWETSTLRTWLNDEFYEVAFSAEDKSAILLTPVNNSHYQSYGEYLHRDWPNTEDYVFLLSYAEAWKYFELDRERNCRASGFAKSQGAYLNKDDQSCGWWLRTPGEDYQDISYVTAVGEIGSVDINDVDLRNAVRPVLWVDLSVLGISPDDDTNAVDTDYGAVGTTVEYGRYEQDNNPDNGKEKIEWIVLDTDGDRRLLLSKYGLDRHKFHNSNVEVFWEDSQLRSWLNDEFYFDAFTAEEQDGIRFTVVDNSEKQFYRAIGNGSKSQDKLFLLSYMDIMHYFPSVESRVCENTDYAKAQNGGGVEKWWLRSPGKVVQFADYIDANGKRNDEAVTGDNFVRPAMWADISALRGDDTSVHMYSRNEFADVGNVVRFGQYEQDNHLENGKEDIEWIVLETDGESSLLISRCAIDRHQYNEVNAELLWPDSGLRTWLNGDFFLTAFSEQEQDTISVSTVNNGRTEWYYNVRSGKNTEDKVYLLSYREAWDFFRDDYERSCAATAYANRDLTKKLHSWWLRSPGKVYHYANYVNPIGLHEDAWICEENYLIRPVIRVDLNAGVFQK